ncbi:hypothetical protein HDU84_004759 [Entophlyctis sp. JEL0112]|nr:hypothetical protein HDU84_004759 [Entophlyctis sp. JEL0112]
MSQILAAWFPPYATFLREWQLAVRLPSVHEVNQWLEQLHRQYAAQYAQGPHGVAPLADDIKFPDDGDAVDEPYPHFDDADGDSLHETRSEVQELEEVIDALEAHTRFLTRQTDEAREDARKSKSKADLYCLKHTVMKILQNYKTIALIESSQPNASVTLALKGMRESNAKEEKQFFEEIRAAREELARLQTARAPLNSIVPVAAKLVTALKEFGSKEFRIRGFPLTYWEVFCGNYAAISSLSGVKKPALYMNYFVDMAKADSDLWLLKNVLQFFKEKGCAEAGWGITKEMIAECIPNLRNFSLLLVGDPFFHVECNACNEGKRFLVQKVSSTIRERLQLVIYNLIHHNVGHRLTDGSMVFQKQTILSEGLEKNWFYLTGNQAIGAERGSVMTTLSQQLTKRVEGLMSLPDHPLPMCTFDGSTKKGNVTRVVIYDIGEDGTILPANSTAIDGAVGFGADTLDGASKKRKTSDGGVAGADIVAKMKQPKIKTPKHATPSQKSVIMHSQFSVAGIPALPPKPSPADFMAHIEMLHSYYAQQINAAPDGVNGDGDGHVRKVEETEGWKVTEVSEMALLEAIVKERDEALDFAEKMRHVAEAALAKANV